MAQDLRDFVTDSHDLLALGEPDHREPAFGRIRNELFAHLAEHGFRSFALETDRVAAFAVDDFVRYGTGTLDTAMAQGFSHGFGEFAANRALVAWMREYNADKPLADRLAFHGIDAPFEFTAESPRRYLEYAADHLGLDRDIRALAGEDERWARMEAVTDPAQSPGGTPEALRLHAMADDLLGEFHARAPELVPAHGRTRWDRARVHLTTALGLLRYHREAARPGTGSERWSRLGGVRDAIMAQNVLDIRALEVERGPTLLCGHNLHLQRNLSRMPMGDMDLAWYGTGAILASLLGDRYACIVGSLSERPAPGTHDTWSLTVAADLLPLERATLEGADAVLHVSAALCARSAIANGRRTPARPCDAGSVQPPEPVTPEPRAPITRPLLTQSWLELAFLHWEVDPGLVARLLPAGTVPDTFDGATYVGLVPFRMYRVGWFGLPGIPYLGTFPEINVRLYSVDRHGRRGVVFRSLDAARLLPVLAARIGFRLPYVWSRMSIRTDGDTRTYTSTRRRPGPRGAHCRLTVRTGEPLTDPTPLEHFLTARWGLHHTVAGRLQYLPNAHPRWPLHRAALVSWDENLLAAAGLPVAGPPMSVLCSPGVPVRFGRPEPA